MNKTFLKILRIILYLGAAYIVIDMFLFNDNANTESKLSLYNKNSTSLYFEFFVSLDNDSNWNALQSSPALGKRLNIGQFSPWKKPKEFESFFESNNYIFVGFYVTPEMLLDRRSFYTISNKIDKLIDHDDKRLSALHPHKAFTAVFVRK